MQVANRHFDVVFGCFVFDPVSLAFQKISLGFWSFVFHLWGIDCSCLRLLFVLLWFFVGFALTAVGSIVLADTVMEYLFFRTLNRTNAFYNMVLPSLFGEIDLHQTKLKQLSRSAVIKKRAKRIHKQRLFSTQ